MSALRRSALALTFALLPVLLSCGEGSLTAPAPAVATTLEVSAVSVTLTASGRTQTLTATVKDQHGAAMTNQTVAWYTSAPAVVTVTSTGPRTAIATGVNDGTATITAATGSLIATTTVTASGVSVVASSIELTADTATLTASGTTKALTATVKDQYGAVMTNQTVSWSTSNPTVATVASVGARAALATAMDDGTATITATITAATGLVSAPATIRVSIKFGLTANGVTVRCSSSAVGEQAVVNGVTYTKRNETQLRALAAGADYAALAQSCTSGVTNMSLMFQGAEEFNQPIGSWDVGSVTDMRGMFQSAYVFNQPIGSWNVGSVTDMSSMFATALRFNQPIGSWNVRSVTNMRSMFENALSFNQPIGSWDVGNVTDMAYMFRQAVEFDQSLTRWCVERIGVRPEGFFDDNRLIVLFGKSPVWGTCPKP